MSVDLAERIESYVGGQRDRKIEEVDKKLAKAIEPEEQGKLRERRAFLTSAYEVDNWLDAAVARASQIRISTHAPKFAHPDVRGGGIFAIGDPSPRSTEVGTHVLDVVQADVDGNAAALDVGNLLLIEEDGSTLWRQVLDGDGTSFERFSQNPERIRQWVTGLAAAVADFSGRSHALAKQTYFPVAGGYHLLSPQFASSLAHEVHSHVERARFSDEAKEARRCRERGAFCQHDDVRYTNIARMKFGGSKPQNVSLLNSKRRGVVYLLNAAPPEWRARISLPTSGREAFWRLYARRSYRTFESLRRFLERVGDFNDVEVRRRRERYIAELADGFLHLVAEIRQEGRPGWSRASSLRLEEQCLLDPERRGESDDEAFLTMLESGDWRAEVSRTFGRYVNRRLGRLRLRGGRREGEFGEVEAGAWAKVLGEELRRLGDDLEFVS